MLVVAIYILPHANESPTVETTLCVLVLTVVVAKINSTNFRGLRFHHLGQKQPEIEIDIVHRSAAQTTVYRTGFEVCVVLVLSVSTCFFY